MGFEGFKLSQNKRDVSLNKREVKYNKLSSTLNQALSNVSNQHEQSGFHTRKRHEVKAHHEISVVGFENSGLDIKILKQYIASLPGPGVIHDLKLVQEKFKKENELAELEERNGAWSIILQMPAQEADRQVFKDSLADILFDAQVCIFAAHTLVEDRDIKNDLHDLLAQSEHKRHRPAFGLSEEHGIKPQDYQGYLSALIKSSLLVSVPKGTEWSQGFAGHLQAVHGADPESAKTAAGIASRILDTENNPEDVCSQFKKNHTKYKESVRNQILDQALSVRLSPEIKAPVWRAINQCLVLKELERASPGQFRAWQALGKLLETCQGLAHAPISEITKISLIARMFDDLMDNLSDKEKENLKHHLASQIINSHYAE